MLYLISNHQEVWNALYLISNHQQDVKVQHVQIAKQQIQLYGEEIQMESLFVMLVDSTTNYTM